jgi:hypothetical protein
LALQGGIIVVVSALLLPISRTPSLLTALLPWALAREGWLAEGMKIHIFTN